MKRIFSLFQQGTLFAILSASALFGSNTTPQRSIRVLIVDGFSNHDWRATTEAIQSILSHDEALTVEVSTIPAQSSPDWPEWNPDFEAYAVVIQNTNDISKKGAWPDAARTSFERYIHEGGGMLAFHSANNAFPQWEAYNQMIGLGWRKNDFGPSIIIEHDKPIRIPTGEGGHTGHGPRVDTVITRLGEHPIHAGLPKQWMAADTEIYRYARGPAENLTVLSYAQDEKTGIHFPTEWVVSYGKGRIYTSTFGHHWHKLSEAPPGMRCRGFQTILQRAVRWAAGADVPTEAPAEFPTKGQVSLQKP